MFGQRCQGVSIHAPRAGSDSPDEDIAGETGQFQSTPPVRGATYQVGGHFDHTAPFQSTPPVRGATGGYIATEAERDVSIHAPRAGSDAAEQAARLAEIEFQSTPPVRGATRSAAASYSVSSRFQSTPPVRGATDGAAQAAQQYAVSIHAPRAGSDAYTARFTTEDARFNPRPPCGERLISGISSW